MSIAANHHGISDATIAANYQAFDGASWSCARMDDDAMMSIDWMVEAIHASPVEAGYPRAYRYHSGAYPEGGVALWYYGAKRLGVQAGGDPDWADATDVREGIRHYMCDPHDWADRG